MTNVESMDYTHSHPSTIASLSCTVQLLPVPHTHYVPSSKQPPYIFLNTDTIPTYHGISIAIPIYIAMQLSIVPFI